MHRGAADRESEEQKRGCQPGLSLIAGRFGCGLLIDRFFAPRVGAAVALIAAASFLSLVLVGPEVAYLAAVGIGLALGAEVDLIGYLVARYYGLEQYGRIFGIYYAVFFLGLGASPLLMATMRESTGSYTLALSSSVIMLILGSIVLLSCPAFTTIQPNVLKTQSQKVIS